jgi:hypothetical protein
MIFCHVFQHVEGQQGIWLHFTGEIRAADRDLQFGSIVLHIRPSGRCARLSRENEQYARILDFLSLGLFNFLIFSRHDRNRGDKKRHHLGGAHPHWLHLQGADSGSENGEQRLFMTSASSPVFLPQRDHKKLKMFRMLCTISAVVGAICLPFVVILAVVFERHNHLIYLIPAFLIYILFQKYDYACIESLYLIFKAEHQAEEQRKFEQIKQSIADTVGENDSEFRITDGQTVIDFPINQLSVHENIKKY